MKRNRRKSCDRHNNPTTSGSIGGCETCGGSTKEKKRAKRVTQMRSKTVPENNDESGPSRWELDTIIENDQYVIDLVKEYQQGTTLPSPSSNDFTFDIGTEHMLVRAVCERCVPLVAGCFGDTSEAETRQEEFMWSVGRAVLHLSPLSLSSSSEKISHQTALCGRLIRVLLPHVLRAVRNPEPLVMYAISSFHRPRSNISSSSSGDANNNNTLPPALLPDVISAATTGGGSGSDGRHRGPLSCDAQRALIALAESTAESALRSGTGVLPAQLAVACIEAPLNIGGASSASRFHARAPACAAEWYVAGGRVLYGALSQGARGEQRKVAVVSALTQVFTTHTALADSVVACLCQAAERQGPLAADPALAALLLCATAHVGMGGPRLSAERTIARLLCRLPGKKPALTAASVAAYSPRTFTMLLGLADRLCGSSGSSGVSTGNGSSTNGSVDVDRSALGIAILRHTATAADDEVVPRARLRVFLALLSYAGRGVQPYTDVCAALGALAQHPHSILRPGLGDCGDECEGEVEGALHECLRERAPELSPDACFALVAGVAPLARSSQALLGAVLEDIYALETEHFEHSVAGICALLGGNGGGGALPQAPLLIGELAACWDATKADPGCVAFFLRHLAAVVPVILTAAEPRADAFMDEILGQFLLVVHARETPDNKGFYWALDYTFLQAHPACFLSLLWCCCSAVLASEDPEARQPGSTLENYGPVADVLTALCTDLSASTDDTSGGRSDLASPGLRDMITALEKDPTLASVLSLAVTALAAFAWGRGGAQRKAVPAALPILDAAAALSARAAGVYATLSRAAADTDATPAELAEGVIPPSAELSALPVSAASLIVSLAYDVLLTASKASQRSSSSSQSNPACSCLTAARCLELAARWGEPYLNLKNLCLVAWSTFTCASSSSNSDESFVALSSVQGLVLQERVDKAGLVRSLQVAALGTVTDIITRNGQLFANVSRTVSLLAGIAEHFCADVADRSKATRSRAKCEVHVALLQAYSAALQALCKAVPARAKASALLQLWALLDPPVPGALGVSKVSSPSKSATKATAPVGAQLSLTVSTSLVVVQLLLDYLPKKEAVLAAKALLRHCVPDMVAAAAAAVDDDIAASNTNKTSLFLLWDGVNSRSEGQDGSGRRGYRPLVKVSIAAWPKTFTSQVVSKCLSTLIHFASCETEGETAGTAGETLPLLSRKEEDVQTFLVICSLASYFLEARAFTGDTRAESRIASLAVILLSVMEKHLAALCRGIEALPIASTDGAPSNGAEVDESAVAAMVAEQRAKAGRVERFMPLFARFAALTIEHNSKVRSGTEEEQSLSKKIEAEASCIRGFLGELDEKDNKRGGDEGTTKTRVKTMMLVLTLSTPQHAPKRLLILLLLLPQLPHHHHHHLLLLL